MISARCQLREVFATTVDELQGLQVTLYRRRSAASAAEALTRMLAMKAPVADQYSEHEQNEDTDHDRYRAKQIE